MAKATTTIVQRLNYEAQHAASLAANQALFNRVVSFYFDAIQAHEQILKLGSMDAMRALEQLTHATDKHPHPVMPLSEIGRTSRPCFAAPPSMPLSARPNPFTAT
jgi:TPP-dependent trihydroxycyclohexane-1,2-dione (THcHDO) dehydratase